MLKLMINHILRDLKSLNIHFNNPKTLIRFGWFKTKTRQFWSVPFVSHNERMVYLEKVKQDIKSDLKK